MLVNAFEVGGIDGIYRATCEDVMHVLRLNKDSLMAVLELFVYDPLADWRQCDSSGVPPQGTPGGKDELHGAIPTPTTPTAASGIRHPVSGNTAPHLNAKAVSIMGRVQAKLTGWDFHKEGKAGGHLDVPLQVERLIADATSVENLSQAFMGWCPYW